MDCSLSSVLAVESPFLFSRRTSHDEKIVIQITKCLQMPFTGSQHQIHTERKQKLFTFLFIMYISMVVFNLNFILHVRFVGLGWYSMRRSLSKLYFYRTVDSKFSRNNPEPYPAPVKEKRNYTLYHIHEKNGRLRHLTVQKFQNLEATFDDHHVLSREYQPSRRISVTPVDYLFW